jgi:choline dehydrogenase
VSLAGAARRERAGSGDVDRGLFDTVVVGGGTAGAIVAARLSEDPAHRVCLIEAGPSDVGQDRVLKLRRWLELLESDLDWDYPTVLQPRGNSHIRHARGRVLGGCSSHNTMICFNPLPGDLADWEAAGAAGWGVEALRPELERLLVRYAPVAAQDRNDLCQAVVEAAATALGIPVVDDFNAAPFSDGAGFLSVGYDPATGVRQSSSVAYLHPVLGRPNLTVLTDTRAIRLVVEGGRATGVDVVSDGRHRSRVHADGEIVLAAGAIDTPRLLLLSGIGPAQGSATWVWTWWRTCPGRREPARPPGVDHRLGDVAPRSAGDRRWTPTSACS